MKTLFIFLAGYCTAEVVSHFIFYFGGTIPFKSFGMIVDNNFNVKAIIFYAVLALIFAYFGFFKK